MYPKRRLGSSNQKVSAIGFGAMGMSSFYGTSQNNDEESLKVLTEAANIGVNFWDTSDMYGPYTNEKLIGRWFKETGRRSEIFLCTKFGIQFLPDNTRTIRGDREYVLKACDASLERLGIKTIDLYYQHRVDTKTPIEVTVRAMKELVEAGKVRYLGLSECSAETLRRACKIHPIAAVQVEYSPFCTEIEDETIKLLKTARELDVAIIAYSPLGRGFLTGRFKSRADFEQGDFRLYSPRFSDENFPSNLKLVDVLKEIGAAHGATSGQIALAWILAQGDDFIPIPGTRQIEFLKENCSSVEIKLSASEMERIGNLARSVKGFRYPEAMLSSCFADSPPE